MKSSFLSSSCQEQNVDDIDNLENTYLFWGIPHIWWLNLLFIMYVLLQDLLFWSIRWQKTGFQSLSEKFLNTVISSFVLCSPLICNPHRQQAITLKPQSVNDIISGLKANVYFSISPSSFQFCCVICFKNKFKNKFNFRSLK